jgi:hypothetical protein
LYHCSFFSQIIEWIAIVLANITTHLLTPLCPLLLALFAPLVSSLRFHSLDHDFRVVILRSVHIFTAFPPSISCHDTRLVIPCPGLTFVVSHSSSI